MGIKGLTQALQRYGVRSPLAGENVVIDGPALVHRVLTDCLVYRKAECSFICLPSYSFLSQLVQGWLDDLKSNNVNV